MSKGLPRSPAVATRLTNSKFLRDSSSFQLVSPGASGTNRNGALFAAWHATHRAWPGRFFRKTGSTCVLKYSSSREAAEEEADRLSCGCLAPTNPDAVKSKHVPASRG